MNKVARYFKAVAEAGEHYTHMLSQSPSLYIPVPRAEGLKEQAENIGVSDLLQVQRPTLIAPIPDISVFDRSLDIDGVGFFQTEHFLGTLDTGLYLPSDLSQFANILSTATKDFLSQPYAFRGAWCHISVTQGVVPGSPEGSYKISDNPNSYEGGLRLHIDADYAELIKGTLPRVRRSIAYSSVETDFIEQAFDVSGCEDNPNRLAVRFKEQVRSESIVRYPSGNLYGFEVSQVHRAHLPTEDTYRTMLNITWCAEPPEGWQKTNLTLAEIMPLQNG